MLNPLRLVPAPLRRHLIDSAEVPGDLASVTTTATTEEVAPASVGLTRAGVDAIWRATERLYATGMHPGISLVLRRHGKVVLKRAIGHARGNGPGDDDATPVPMTPRTRPSTAMMQLIQTLVTPSLSSWSTLRWQPEPSAAVL